MTCSVLAPNCSKGNRLNTADTVGAQLPELIEALLQPHRYPGKVQSVQLVQTHISWVLLTGEFAYKIKKPVRLPFLDFSTLALRKKYCDEELRLNKRFSIDLYLEVVGIFNSQQEPWFTGPGLPIEYAVKLRQFDPTSRLDRVCQRGELQPTHLSDLAESLVTFHTNANRAPADSRFGSIPQVMAPTLETLQDLSTYLPQAETQSRLMVLQTWFERQFKQHSILIVGRKNAGFVRECHGDLHLENLVLIDQHVHMFDCIEFNEDLRWIDVASEIALTYVDLIAHARPGLATWFVNEVCARTGDYQAMLIMRIYSVYRALVRAKVAAIQSQQFHQNDANALAYVSLAEELVKPQELQLIITHGLSGCGKTTESNFLLQNDSSARTIRLRSDTERKRLPRLPEMYGINASPDTGMYAPNIGVQTYQRLLELAEVLLQAGWSVIVDATFLKQADRTSFHALAVRANSQFSILAPKAAPDELRERILRRQASATDASEATLEVLAHQLQVIEPLTQRECTFLRTADAARNRS